MWTAVSKFVQISFDLAPIPVWPGEGCLLRTKHLGDPEASRIHKSDTTKFTVICVIIDDTVPD